uniref:Uncharacterized protein n=1 Tax=Panagrolaimus sp. JU765 TaxID=591449 RepID=A0AC34RB18_9BILA
MKAVFIVLCMMFVVINGFEYGKDLVTRECAFTFMDSNLGSHDRNYENYLGDKYTYWVRHCSYDNRVIVECSNGKINPGAIIEVTEYDNWPNENDHVDRFEWTKIADDGKSAYVDIHIDPAQLMDQFMDDYAELYWWFDNPCSDGKSYNDRDMFKQKFVF